jgi:hypothetical protein
MKFRKGFVSNSSSSSFVCDTCKETFSGWDASPSEFEHQYCVNGHVICEDEIMVERGEEFDFEDWDYEVPAEYCPCCQFQIVSDDDIEDYLRYKYKVSRDDAFAEVKALNKRRKKLYPHEYVVYVCKQKDTTIDAEVESLKEEFDSYNAFRKAIRNY